MKKWLKAFRLRTLPLSLSCIILSGFIAKFFNGFKLDVLLWSILTTTCLQILSNLANDYGDYQNGADHDLRKGPQRTVQSGEISPLAMKRMIYFFVVFSLVSGISLLLTAFSLEKLIQILAFLALGIFAIWAAIKYTMGNNPYGYKGFGDVFVFLFFGWVGVVASLYLHLEYFKWEFLLPATSIGMFSVAVLNVNNIRDIESDKLAGKRSIPVVIGRTNALVYHKFLLFTGIICGVFFLGLSKANLLAYLHLLALPLFISNYIGVSKSDNPTDIDPYLKQMALTTLVYSLLFGGLLLI